MNVRACFACADPALSCWARQARGQSRQVALGSSSPSTLIASALYASLVGRNGGKQRGQIMKLAHARGLATSRLWATHVSAKHGWAAGTATVAEQPGVGVSLQETMVMLEEHPRPAVAY
ncbi:hypothetical protein HaLaN_09476 [Haematococcus lacustris]|uniref:Uncharacterized protein n=1 Tax=Haematococcus lacustris TaxID=44745 RepID=A0A699YWI4_HAELA|nr:hypothetical protein HaLaN_09476 [Haematococcus lacustris]